jgi:hypothetical protein
VSRERRGREGEGEGKGEAEKDVSTCVFGNELLIWRRRK